MDQGLSMFWKSRSFWWGIKQSWDETSPKFLYGKVIHMEKVQEPENRTIFSSI